MKRNFVPILVGCCLFLAWNVSAAGGKLAGKVIEETLELAAGRSGRVLTPAMRIDGGKLLTAAAAKYGDDVVRLVRGGGFEVLEQGAKHGDEFWRLCRENPAAARALALHPDELMPLAQRIGPSVLKMEVRAPGMSARVAETFGDDAVRILADVPQGDLTRLLGYANRADSPETRNLLLSRYRKAGNPGAFLDHLNWKHIMATGLSAAAITAAYQVSEGVGEGLRANPEVLSGAITKIIGFSVLGVAAVMLLLFGPWMIGRLRRCRLAMREKQNSSDFDKK